MQAIFKEPSRAKIYEQWQKPRLKISAWTYSYSSLVCGRFTNCDKSPGVACVTRGFVTLRVKYFEVATYRLPRLAVILPKSTYFDISRT